MNLPVHRWIELNEEADANEAFNTYTQETNMYTDVAANTYTQETNYQQLNARYKTEMCRHFKRTGYCPLEKTCQFAHGNHELRRWTDPLPEKFDDKSLGAVHSNYKTSACRNFHETGQCKFGASCSFFHFPSEQRKLTDPLPNLMLQQQDCMQANSNMDFSV